MGQGIFLKKISKMEIIKRQDNSTCRAIQDFITRDTYSHDMICLCIVFHRAFFNQGPGYVFVSEKASGLYIYHFKTGIWSLSVIPRDGRPSFIVDWLPCFLRALLDLCVSVCAAFVLLKTYWFSFYIIHSISLRIVWCILRMQDEFVSPFVAFVGNRVCITRGRG